MSCCGGNVSPSARPLVTQSSGDAATATHWVSRAVEFEYTGQGSLVVTGPLTGTEYRFAGNGARVRVLGEDAPSVVSVPGLRPVR
jgi:hypothetical protein